VNSVTVAEVIYEVIV